MSVVPQPVDPAMPGWLLRQPTLIANLLAAAVLAVCSLLRTFGVPLTDSQQNGIVTVAGLTLLLVTPLLAKKYTTPLLDPRDSLGRPLTPDVALGGPVTRLGE